MTNSKSTRRALFTSALAMLMCVAMLIGTTFAWFTDTASTAVNKIQSGKLDVALEMYDTTSNQWVNAEGQTLQFKKAAGGAGQAVLWEPGCTYELPELRIVNKGNLALKYKVVITGIKGSSELNEAIEWTIDDVALGTEQHLLAGASNEFTIKGHMKDDAGNEYQDKTIEGISITVYATQDTVEFDSTGKDYDAEAQYPVVAVSQVAVDSASKKTTTNVTIKSAETVSEVDTTPLATAIVPNGVLTTSADGETSTQLKLTIDKTAVPANFTYDVDEQDAKTLEVKMTGLASTNTTPVTVKMYVGTGLTGFKLYHNSIPMTAKDSAEGVTDDQTYYYDSATGMVTMATATFSPFTYVYDNSISVASMEDLSVACSADWARIVKPGKYKLTQDITVSKALAFLDGVEIDLGTHTLTYSNSASYRACFANADEVNVTIKNGNIYLAKNNSMFWDASARTANLTFKDVTMSFESTNSGAMFKSQPYNGESNLNITGDNLLVKGRFIWAVPKTGATSNIKASGVTVKTEELQYIEALKLDAKDMGGKIIAEFSSCSFDTSNRGEEPIRINTANTTASGVSLTMTDCSLITANPENLNKYINILNTTATNVTLTLNDCTGNNGTKLTVD